MPSKFYTDEQFDEIAQTILNALGLKDDVKLDVIELLRRLKRHGYIADYVRVPDTALADAEAKYVPQERKIYIRESAYQGAVVGEPHYRFTVCHEVSHVVLDHQFERKRSLFGSHAAERRVPAINRDEAQANKLAAALLAPFYKAAFGSDTTCDMVQKRFGLSCTTAQHRFEELSHLYRLKNNLPRALPPGVIDFLSARRAEGHAVTSLPAQDLAALQLRQPRYTGDPCPVCRGFKMIRIGNHLLCDECSAVTGDD